MNTTTLGLSVFERIISDIEPLYVNLAGFGEPLIDREIVQKLIFLRNKGIRSSVPTNGTYIRNDKRDELAAELPDILQLSIDGATKESFEAIRKRGNFDAIVENYRKICAMRASGQTRPNTTIRVACALQRRNLFDYRAMYALVRSLDGVDSFGLVPVSHGAAQAAEIPDKHEVLALHRELGEAITVAESDDEKSFYKLWRSVSGEWLTDKIRACSDASIDQARCSIPWFSSYIDAKRRVYPCCYLTRTEHVMGTLRTDGSGFAEIWAGPRYRAFRSNHLSARSKLSGCRKCPRNDVSMLSTLAKLHWFLPRAKPSG
ncbi:MAG TPA: SPASM domain-containing protein, partial [Rhizomicrobium sp.]|nr:SPASM domain-containing protein [Rhizomicrobium sp.]